MTAPTFEIQKALTALKTHFNFDEFREGQSEVCQSLLEGNDTVVVMPTGGGKSLCYQLPAMMRPGVTIVISPLIALMKDQVDALHARNLPATFINSSISFDEQRERIHALRKGQYRMVYIAPERFRSAAFLDALKSLDVSLFAVDEAHCVSHWGHDFRPDYLRLKQAAVNLGRPPIAALTATATPYVRSDIIDQLGMVEPNVFVSGFDRPNLKIQVVNTEKEREKISQIRNLAAIYENQSGIIYTSTRKAVDQVASKLGAAGLSVTAYHAGLTDEQRRRAHEDFMSGRVQMIVATNAFGMGIDKPDIRFVAHYHLPGSIEAYYQEIGRAGRDGRESECRLLFNYADKRTQDYFIEGSFPTPEILVRVYQSLAGVGQTTIELSASEIAARAGVKNEMSVNSALVILEKAGHIERLSASENRAEVRLRMRPADARERIGNRDTRQRSVLFILLNNSSVSERASSEISIREMADQLGEDEAAVRRSMATLAELGVIEYKPARRSRGIRFLDKAPAARLNIKPEDLARRAALENRKLREMISFCYTDRCYRSFILDYFGESRYQSNCGSCGNCVDQKPLRSNTRRNSDETSELDQLIIDHRPIGPGLDDELQELDRRTRELRSSEERAREMRGRIEILPERELAPEEKLVVRMILACAARMQGRFGKNMLASVLRGSKAKNVLQAGLDELSTYGLLNEMNQDELLSYIESMVKAGALQVSLGTYPTIKITPLGSEVMHERRSLKLMLPEVGSAADDDQNISRTARKKAGPLPNTARQTYRLVLEGLSIEEIAKQRGLTEITIEGHLADLIKAGHEVDVSRYVSADDRSVIQHAIKIHGSEFLRPIRDACPPNMTWRMIKFVVAEARAKAAQHGAEISRSPKHVSI